MTKRPRSAKATAVLMAALSAIAAAAAVLAQALARDHHIAMHGESTGKTGTRNGAGELVPPHHTKDAPVSRRAHYREEASRCSDGKGPDESHHTGRGTDERRSAG
jgi:hypothetical protein